MTSLSTVMKIQTLTLMLTLMDILGRDRRIETADGKAGDFRAIFSAIIKQPTMDVVRPPCRMISRRPWLLGRQAEWLSSRNNTPKYYSTVPASYPAGLPRRIEKQSIAT